MTMTMTMKELGLALIQIKSTGNSEAITSDGGAAVGEAMWQAIFDAIPTVATSIYLDAQKLFSPNETLKVPSNIDSLETEPTSGARAYWTEEATAATVSVVQFRGVSLKLGKLTVRVPCTAEIYEDAADYAATVTRQAAAAIVRMVQKEQLLGEGAIKGVAASGDDATITVAVSSDAAPTLAELASAVDAIHPAASPTWYVTPTLYSYLMMGLTTTNTLAKVLTFDDGKYFLFGFPVERCPWLIGTSTPFVLGDFSRYALALKPLRSAYSTAIRFAEDELTFIAHLRVAGNTFAVRSECDDGETYGWFVTTADGGALASSSSSSSDSSASSASTLTSASSASSLSSASSASSESSSSDSSASSASSGPEVYRQSWNADPDPTYDGTGGYADSGEVCNGEYVWRQMGGNYLMWYDDGGPGYWVVSSAVGSLGLAYWVHSVPGSTVLGGTYVAGGAATEDLVVSN